MEYFIGIFDQNPQDETLDSLHSEYTSVEQLRVGMKWDGTAMKDAGSDVFKDLLAEHEEKVTVFHFSGHHKKGRMASKNADLNSKALIKFLDDCPRLKIVFINGCNSQEFAQNLKNVPLVIGTTKNIIDSYAKGVSIRFYENIKKHGKKLDSFDDVIQMFEKARTLESTDDAKKDDNITPRGSDDFDFWNSNDKKDVYLYHKDEELWAKKSDWANPDANRKYFEHIEKSNLKWDKEELQPANLHQYYPYFFATHLFDLMPQLNSDEEPVAFGDLTDLGKYSYDRIRIIKDLHCELVVFLKFCAYSILWTIFQDSPKGLKMNKDLLKKNLEYDYKDALGPEKIDELKKIYDLIPLTGASKIIDAAFMKSIKNLFEVKHLDRIKEDAKFFSQVMSKSQDQLTDDDYYTAETYLHRFVSGDEYVFIRDVSVRSVYNVNWVRYRDQTEGKHKITQAGFLKKYKPGGKPSIVTRALESSSVGDLSDIIVQSIYLQKDNRRILNLSPFYYDENAGDPNADKFSLYYLSQYHEVDISESESDLMDSEEEGDLTKKITFFPVRLDGETTKEKQVREFTNADMKDQDKRVYKQFQFFWKQLS